MENMIKYFWDRNKIILKSFFIGMLVLLLLIPAAFYTKHRVGKTIPAAGSRR